MMVLSEASFGRQVLRAPLPTLVLFGGRGCPASRALAALLGPATEDLAGQLRAGRIGIEACGPLAEQYGVRVAPTLVLFAGGEPRTAAAGFLPDGLLRALCGQIARDELPPGALWSPSEELFEDAVVAPLLEQCGLSYRRQAACAAPGGRALRRRVDFLVAERPGAPPLTLIESKRRIGSQRDLQRAAEQALGYAQAHALGSFVVAAPAGMWFYRSHGARPLCTHALTALEIHERPTALAGLLRQLR